MKTATAPLPPLRSVKVLDKLRERTPADSLPGYEQAYILGSCLHHSRCVTATLGSSEVEAFLYRLANERKVSVSTHHQALAPCLFFWQVLCWICFGFRRSEDLGRRGACRWC